MRYRMQVTRVQTVERSISATDEDAAMQKIQAELHRPYGLLGSWTTQAVEVEVLGAESRISGVAADIGDGPLVFSVKGAAERLGVSRSVLYELVRSGEIEHVRVGKRILVSRAALERFIETNTRVGYNR
jgi:excisionase family DNA binding protein